MADYSNYPAYRAASEKAQELYNQLYGYQGRTDSTGLASAMDRVAATKGDNSPELARLKAKFDATQKEYEAAKAKAQAMRTEIDADEIRAKTEKDKVKKEETKSKDVANLTQQRDSLARQNKSAEAQAIQAQIDVIKNPVSTDATSSNAVQSTPQEDYAGYTLDPTGKVFGPGGVQGLFVPVPDSSGKLVNQFITSGNKAIESFLKPYQGSGQLDTLKKKLVASGYVKQEQLNGTAWLGGLTDMLSNYSSDYLYKIKIEGAKDVPSIDVFMSQKKAGTGTGSKSYRVITTRGDAKKLLDSYMSDLVGRPATKEEESAFYDQLHTAENKAAVTTTGGTTTGSVLADADRLMIAAGIARKTLRGTNVDELLKSSIGSTVASDIASIQKYAAAYGVEMTSAEALKRVADGIGQKDYVAKQEERLRLIAKQLHPNLSAHIDAGGTVADIADQYAYAKSKKLGVAVPMSTTDSDVMNAVNSGMSVSDFNRAMQQKPEWRKTDEAHSVANDFVNTMLKTFGLVG